MVLKTSTNNTIPFDNKRLRNLLSSLDGDKRSRLFESLLRYCAFNCCFSNGADIALQQVKQWWESKEYEQLLGRNDSFVYLGVKRELEFYRRFNRSLHLVPTLDAGCAFDMVGQLKHAILCIDVTNNIKRKSEKDAAKYMRVPDGWKKMFAELDGNGIQFFTEWYSLCGHRKTMKESNQMANETCNQTEEDCFAERNLEMDFFVSRYVWLNYIECGKPICLAFEGLLPMRNISESDYSRLVAHLWFYATYREPLKLVPALSCGDCTDFVGDSSGRLVRYLVLVDKDGFHEKYGKYLESRQTERNELMIVFYSALNKVFHFFRSDELPKIDPNIGIPEE